MANGTPSTKKGRSAAAIAEANNGDGRRTVQTQGLTLTVTSKIPFAVLRYIRKESFDMVAVLEMLLDPPEQIDDVWAADLTLDAGAALITDLIESGGVSVGES